MHNYDHEIARPEDRAMCKFLWCDYFQDSEILSAQIEGEKRNRIIVTLRSDRDERAEWRKFGGDYEKWRAYVEENAEKYIYILKFTNAVYFERKQAGIWLSEYMNARFKDTALLRRLQEKSEKRLYHLRIHTTDGLMDLIFGGFEIRRLHGRVNYSMRDIAEAEGLNEFEKEMAAEQKYKDLPKDDFERFLLLERMYAAEHPSLLRAARDCLAAEEVSEDAKPYAAHLMGKLGDETDMPKLMETYFELERDLLKTGYDYRTVMWHKQNIIDAIELIRYRAAERLEGGENAGN